MLFNQVCCYTTKKGKDNVNADKLVIGLAGMPGSGKSLIVDTARELGYAVVVMGDVVRQETINRGFELTPQNVGKVMLELRQKEGNFVIAQKCVPTIQEQISNKVLVDGLRSLYEADIFKEHFSRFTLVAVHASPEIRFKRLSNRHRSDDPKEWKVFNERDMRELTVGLGNVIAMAEQMIVNDNTLEQVKAKIKESLEKVEEKWMK
jgi:dephospho-CoA kinase